MSRALGMNGLNVLNGGVDGLKLFSRVCIPVVGVFKGVDLLAFFIIIKQALVSIRIYFIIPCERVTGVDQFLREVHDVDHDDDDNKHPNKRQELSKNVIIRVSCIVDTAVEQLYLPATAPRRNVWATCPKPQLMSFPLQSYIPPHITIQADRPHPQKDPKKVPEPVGIVLWFSLTLVQDSI